MFNEDALYSAALGFVSAGLFNAAEIPSYYRDAKADTQSPVQPLPTAEAQVQELPVVGQEKINPGARKSIREIVGDIDNTDYDIPKISTPVFKDENGAEISKSKYPSALRKYMLKLFKGKVFDIGKDHKVYISKRGIEEYLYPAKRLDDDIKIAKQAAGSVLDETLKPAMFLINIPDDGRHPEATGGWDNFYVMFATDDGIYSGVVKTKNTENGREFYDITEIQKEDINPNASDVDGINTPLASKGSNSTTRGVNEDNSPPATKSMSSTTTIPQTPPVVNPDVAELPVFTPEAQVQELPVVGVSDDLLAQAPKANDIPGTMPVKDYIEGIKRQSGFYGIDLSNAPRRFVPPFQNNDIPITQVRSPDLVEHHDLTDVDISNAPRYPDSRNAVSIEEYMLDQVRRAGYYEPDISNAPERNAPYPTDTDAPYDYGKEKIAPQSNIQQLSTSEDQVQGLSISKINDDVNNYEKFTYKNLTKESDMQVSTLNSFDVYDRNGKLDRKNIIARGMKNVRNKNNARNTSENAYVYVPAIKKNVLVGTRGLSHGLSRKAEASALATSKIGDILENSIVVNELLPREGTDGGYVLLGIAKDSGNNLYPTRIIVNRFSEVEDIDVLYAVLTKKKNQSSNEAELSANAVPPIKGSSIITIAQLLELVKNDFSDVLSDDVLNALGVKRKASSLSDSIKFVSRNNKRSTISDSSPTPVQESTPVDTNTSTSENTNPGISEGSLISLEGDDTRETTTDSLAGWVNDKIEDRNQSYARRAEESQNIKAVTKVPNNKPGAKKQASELSNEFRRKFVDAGASVQDMAKVTGDTHLYAYYNNAKQAQAAGQNMITKAQTNLKGKKVGKSLDEIFKPVLSMGEKYTEDFQEYMYHRHNIDRIKAGKPITFTEDLGSYMKTSTETVDTLLRQHPEFEKIADDVYTYLRNLMQMRVDAGLVTKQEADFMNELYPHYVPTHRVMGENYFQLDTIGEQNAAIGTGIKRALGSDLELMPLYEQISQMTMQTVSQAKRNVFATRLANLIYNDPMQTASFAQVPKEYDGMFGLDDLKGEMLNGNMLVYHRNGKTEALRLSDEMVEAIKDLQVKSHGRFYNGMRKASTIYKSLITEYNPVFTIRNFMRDFPDALFASKDTASFLRYLPEAMKDMKNGGEIWQQFEALGGTASSFFDYDYKSGTFNKSGWLKRNTLDRISEMNRFVEMVPRFAEFYATVKKGDGGYANLMDALHNAAEITVNFQRGGSWARPMNATFFPFLNASIQGASKNLRIFTEAKGAKQWLGLAIKAALFGLAPSVINELLLGDDEEYKELRDYDKMDNYIFKLPNNQFIKIPGGRLTKSIGTFGAEVVKLLRGDETNFGKVGMNALSQVGPLNPMESNIFAPIANVSNNLSWFGGEIENARLQELPVAERYDSKTSEIGKWVGKTFNVSPKKVDYLIDSYTGILGDTILPVFTNPEGDDVSLGDKVGTTMRKAFVDPLAKKFYIDGTMSNEISSKFYDKRDELSQISNGSGATAADELTSKYMNSQNKKLSELYSNIRQLESDTSLPYSERQSDIRKVQEQINNIQRTALSNVEKYSEAAKKYSNKEEDVAYFLANRDVLGLDYAINSMSSESKAEKMRTLTSANIDAEKSFDIMDKLDNMKSDTDDWGKSISGSKNKKSVEYVEGLGLSSKQKAAIYKTYMFSDLDERYSYIAGQLGIDDNIIGNVFGTLSTIESSKNSAGKTISGSQNRNVYNYINTLDLSGEQRRMLFAWFASSTNEQKKQRYNVINNLNISTGDKNTVLEWLMGNKKISDDHIKKIFGRIKK